MADDNYKNCNIIVCKYKNPARKKKSEMTRRVKIYNVLLLLCLKFYKVKS